MPPMQEHPQGTLILIFGILGIFITIFAPIAWYMGNKAKKEIQTSGIQYSNEQNISIGRMLGKIFTIIAIISIVIVIILWIVVVLSEPADRRRMWLRADALSAPLGHHNRECDDRCTSARRTVTSKALVLT